MCKHVLPSMLQRGEGVIINTASTAGITGDRVQSVYGASKAAVISFSRYIATAYGHQEQIAVSCGEQVSQGQVIGYVGCTGHCFGPHLHFEVRINGTPVDPLGYL